MDFFERIAGEWYERAPELADWVMAHLVNRTDVWGRYTRRKSDEASRAVTVPFRDERGKVFLDSDSLRKHFRTRQPGGQLGIHTKGWNLFAQSQVTAAPLLVTPIVMAPEAAPAAEPIVLEPEPAPKKKATRKFAASETESPAPAKAPRKKKSG